MIYSRGNLAVSRVASQDELESQLNCVFLDEDGSTVACNGRAIMAVGPVDEDRIRFPDVGEQTKPGEEGICVPLDLIGDALKNLPRTQHLTLQHAALTEANNPTEIEFTCTDTHKKRRVSGFPKTEGYIQWRDIFQDLRGDEPCARVCINRAALIQLLAAIDEACPDRGGEAPLYLEIHPKGRGIILRSISRETNQKAVAGVKAYDTKGSWLEMCSWEKRVFEPLDGVKLIVLKD
jgi:hypothetical protein